MKARFASILMLFLVCPAHAEEAYQATAKVWDAMGRKNWDAAIAQANRVIRISVSYTHLTLPTTPYV